MKRIINISLFILCSFPLIAQTGPVKPLKKKEVVVKFEKDFQNFNKKVAKLNNSRIKKAQLANEYSDLIDRMDQQFHNTPSKIKSNTSVSLVQKSKTHIDH